MHRPLIYTLLVIISFCYSFSLYAQQQSTTDDRQNEARMLFKKAQSYENYNNYQVAISAYEEIYAKYGDQLYAEESLFKKAVILDEKLFLPSEALEIYQEYIEIYNGRHSRRAEIRINALKRYKDINLVTYKEFQTILNSYRPGENAVFIQRLERFVKDYPDYKALDDALFWLANEYRGRQRIPQNEEEFSSIRKAIPIYNRILDEYPNSPHKVVVLKNIGDCHYLLKNFGKAQSYYNLVKQQGGGFASRLIGNDMMRANINSNRYKGFIIALIALVGALVAIYKVIPIKKINLASGLKTGLFHSMLFIPAAIILPVVIFYLTDAKHNNMTGMEPWLMILIMVVTLFFIVANGLIMELDSRLEIKMKFYLPSLMVLHLSITYILFYSLGLMTYIERLFI